MVDLADYSTFGRRQKCRVSSILEEFVEELTDVYGKCMDIGCGPGDITKDVLLPALGSNVQLIGTDISEDIVKYANEIFSVKNRLCFEVLDIETKSLPKKYVSEFDYIFSFHTLQWCKDIRQACKNIYEMLRPNGTILLYIVATNDIYEALKVLIQDTRFTEYIPDILKHVAPYQESNNARKEVKELLQSVGFTIYQCSLREINEFEEKPEEFLKSIMGLFTFLNNMPQNLVEEFKNIFITEFLKRKIKYKSMDDDKELTLDRYKGLIVYGQKL